jgi:DNA topoisomerase-1
MGVDIENNFEPTYEVTADKKKVVAQLRKDAIVAIFLHRYCCQVSS